MKTQAEIETKITELEEELANVEPMSDEDCYGCTQQLIRTLRWVLGADTYLDEEEKSYLGDED